jgi:type IV pilus assembly protein PilA
MPKAGTSGEIMRSNKHQGMRGFTLIELMIVVAIVGVLAVLAVYGVRRYIASSKTAEARNQLGQIGKDAQTAYEKETMAAAVLSQGTSTSVLRALCKSATKTVPQGGVTAIKGRKYQSSPAEWTVDAATNAGFSCLKFEIDQPQYYLYNYTATVTGAVGDSFTASANGDLNGDGVLSTFTWTGTVGSGLVLNLAPNMNEVNPEE